MKKAVALFFVVLFLCGASASAFAETGYVVVRELLLTAMETSFSIQGYSGPLDELYDENTVTVWVDLEDNEVLVVGKNSSNKPEGTIWELEEPLQPFVILYYLCERWDGITKCMTDGYCFEIVLNSEDGDDAFIIDTAKKANFIVETIKEKTGI